MSSNSAWTLERCHDLLVLRFDVAGESVNVLREDNMDALEQCLTEAASIEGIRGLLIMSAKPNNFIAGADINAIAKVETAADGEAASRRGQEVFQKLENLPFPTVACIHGACLGGGLELALACRYRIASESKSTKLGLPEVMLGILPGFGGTQRLPRKVGLLASLPLLMTGKMLNGRRAAKIGLVDDVVPAELLHQKAEQILARPAAKAQGALVPALYGVGRTNLGAGSSICVSPGAGTSVEEGRDHLSCAVEDFGSSGRRISQPSTRLSAGSTAAR